MTQQLISLEQLAEMKSPQLAALDIVALNYYAAHGLAGTSGSDLDHWNDKLDDFAQRVKFEIRRHLYRMDVQSSREPTPFSYGNSLARFFCWMMLQVLQEDCGVRYHPERKFKPDFCQPRDVFVHGILDDDGQGGTCASMPVVYVSVGRRLGLPVYLVETRGHAFFRWDSPNGVTIHWEKPDLALWIPPDRFNVEGAGEGIAYYSDSHYVQWPEVWQEVDIRHGRYLRSMSATESLAGFLIERGECFWDIGKPIEALRSYHCARQLVPDDERYNQLHAVRSRQHLEAESRLQILKEQEAAAERKRITGTAHLPACECLECRRRMNPAQRFPHHGPSCMCFTCSQDREAAKQPAGMPGHLPLCQCAGCFHQRSMSGRGVRPGMPTAGHFPHERIRRF